MKAVGLLADRLGRPRLAQRIDGRSFLLHTAVPRRIEWLLVTELLELPCRQHGRVSRRNEMADDALERQMLDPAAQAFAAHDH